MIRIRQAADRGYFDHGWLRTYHTFSFGDYQDALHNNFRALRVINEDWVEPSRGFGMHSHRDMEIVTYVLDGALEHKDSMGNGSILRPGEFQRMSAGTGILHSEFNPSDSEPVHLYQIWLFPRRKGLQPSYEQKVFDAEERTDRWQLVASPDGKGGSLTIHQDAEIYLATLSSGAKLGYELHAQRHVWLQLLRGAILLNGLALAAGDGAAVSSESQIELAVANPAEVMLFELD
jgi:redox-sensitive bicupin YhaK (pirin superfamily)